MNPSLSARFLAVFEQAPDAFTATQRKLFIALFAVHVVTRLLAISRTLWDWDEALFAAALRDFDITRHNPHPPGFPIYVAFAKVVHLVVRDEFRSVQTVSVIAAILLFPVVVWLAREMRMGNAAALAAAVFTAFAANVWIYGGTAFSDVCSLTLVLAAVAALLRGCRDVRWRYAAAVILACAVGVRSQNLVVAAPAAAVLYLVMLRQRAWKHMFAVAVISAVIAASAYGAAAWATGSWSAYRKTVLDHRHYIVVTDSFKSPARPPLSDLFNVFFMNIVRGGATGYAIDLLAVLGLLSLSKRGARLPVLLIATTFVPFAIVAFLYLDRFSVGRFGVAWVPLYTLLAAHGLFAWSKSRHATVAASALATILSLALIGWSWPALSNLRSTSSPPSAAMQWIRQHADPRRHTIYVEGGLAPHARLRLADYRLEFIRGLDDVPLDASDGFVLRNRRSRIAGSVNFVRDRFRLWKIVRHSYFESSVMRVSDVVTFDESWHDEEWTETDSWRWMKQRGSFVIRPSTTPMTMTLEFDIPSNLVPQRPEVTVAVDGQNVRHIPVTAESNAAIFTFAPHPRPRTVTLSTSHITNPKREGVSGDGRDLGLRLKKVRIRAVE